MSVTTAIVALAIFTYILRVAGLAVPTEKIEPYASPITAAILAARIATSTVATDEQLALDHRVIGLVVAIAALAAKRSLLTVVVAAVTVTAMSRLLVG